MNKPLVSIIIPVYNTLQYLQECVESVLMQDYDPIEVILVDDCSPDGAGALCDQLAQAHEHVRVVHHEQNQGLDVTRRTGIEHAKGEYITFLDSDDLFVPTAISTMMGYMLTDDLDYLSAQYIRFFTDGSRLVGPDHTVANRILTGDEWLQTLLLPDNRCGGCFSISRRSIWHSDVFLPKGLRLPSEDVVMLISLSKYVRRAKLVNDYVYLYRYNTASLSIQGVYNQQPRIRQWFQYVEGKLRSFGKLDALKGQLLRLQLHWLTFYIYDVDSADPWVASLLRADRSMFTRRERIQLALLPYNRLRRAGIYLNRVLKRITGKARIVANLPNQHS